MIVLGYLLVAYAVATLVVLPVLIAVECHRERRRPVAPRYVAFSPYAPVDPPSGLGRIGIARRSTAVLVPFRIDETA